MFTSVLRQRVGTALLLVLLVLVVLDCIVLGTVHLTMLEQRTAANAAAALRLRLAAESAARRVAAAWSVTIDTLAIGAPPVLVDTGSTATGAVYDVSAEQVRPSLYLLRADARERAPGHGRAAALLLVRAPPWPPGFDPGPAALSVAGRVTLSGTINGPAHTGACGAARHTALRMHNYAELTVIGAGAITGSMELLPADAAVSIILPRLLELAADDSLPDVRIITSDYRLIDSSGGVLIVTGDVTLAGAAHFSGLLITAGRVTVEPRAIVTGAVHAAGSAEIAGTVRFDPCVAGDALARSQLRAARATHRAWLPAF